MCNRYTPPALRDIEREWALGRQNPVRWWDEVLFPRGTGPFIRRARDAVGYERELVVGQWGLIPWFAKEPRLKYPTNNARSEELAGAKCADYRVGVEVEVLIREVDATKQRITAKMISKPK